MFPCSACLGARSVFYVVGSFGKAGDGFSHGSFGSQFQSKRVFIVDPKGSVGYTVGSNPCDCRVWSFKENTSLSRSSLQKCGHRRHIWVDVRVLPKEDVAKELDNYEDLAWTDPSSENKSVTKQGGVTGTRLLDHSRNFADILYSMAQLHSNLDEQELQLLEEEMLGDDTGKAPADYSRRADIFGRSAVVFAARKEEGDKIAGNLLDLEEDVIKQDSGRTAADYNRRAEIFSKSAEIFTTKSGK